jgi:hypothetical protein
MRRLTTSLCAAAATILWSAAAWAQGEVRATIRGDVIAREGQVALPHAMVTLEPIGRQTFTSDDGSFRFVDVAPGVYRLRVNRIGYTPAEVAITVGAAGAPDPVIVTLTHILVRLTPVRVIAYPPCVRPGPPSAKDAPDFAIVFEQLRQNADQYRVLADSFPFSYTLVRYERTVFSDSSETDDGTSQLTVHSQDDDLHRYRVGDVIVNVAGRREIRLPTLRDFASADFLRNHCFHDAGVDSTVERPRVRIDFEPADRIREPDVRGSIYLDAATFQITRAELTLSKMPSNYGAITAVNMTTIFREVVPSIVVLGEIRAETRGRPRPERNPNARQAVMAVEVQRLVRFLWLKRDPSKSP